MRTSSDAVKNGIDHVNSVAHNFHALSLVMSFPYSCPLGGLPGGDGSVRLGGASAIDKITGLDEFVEVIIGKPMTINPGLHVIGTNPRPISMNASLEYISRGGVLKKSSPQQGAADEY